MAILVNASIFDSSCSKQLLPWTVFSIEDERMTLDRCFEVVVNKSATNIQEHIASGGHKLEEVRIGQTRDVLDRVGDTSKYKQKVLYECIICCTICGQGLRSQFFVNRKCSQSKSGQSSV